MTAGTHNFKAEQGADFIRQITWQDADGNAIDLSGYSARMQVRREVDDSAVLLELTTENGYITLGGAAGTIDLNFPASGTTSLSSSAGVYDLELVSGGGVITRLLQGTFDVSREVTR